MKKIVVSEWMTLDGVFDASTMAQWFNPYASESRSSYIQQGVMDADAFLIGRTTYDMLAPFWSQAKKNEMGIGDKMNSIAKYVVTSHPLPSTWNNSTAITGDIVGEIKKLKELPGDGHIRVTGSAKLVKLLMDAGVIDEYRFLLHPLIVGNGKKFFTDDMHERLQLESMIPLDKGVAIVIYKPDRAKKTTNSQSLTF